MLLHWNYSASTWLYFLNISIFLKSNTLNVASLKCIIDKALVSPKLLSTEIQTFLEKFIELLVTVSWKDLKDPYTQGPPIADEVNETTYMVKFAGSSS